MCENFMDFHIFAFVKLKTKTKADHPDMGYINTYISCTYTMLSRIIKIRKTVKICLATFFTIISITYLYGSQNGICDMGRIRVLLCSQNV